jgi:hypothetical protein
LNGVCYNATNDRVYASVGSVGTDSVNILDCASDQYVSQIPVGRWPTRLVWNDVSNKVYVANQLSGSISIIRDSGGGIEEAARHEEQPAKLATIVHGVMYLPKASGPDRVPQAVLLDISGRKVLALSPGRNSVRSLASGVYFLRFSDQSNVQKIVVSR